METCFSMIVKGNLREVKEACKLHKAACFHARKCQHGFLVKANADFRDVVEWFCETKGSAPFAAGTLLHYRNIS